MVVQNSRLGQVALSGRKSCMVSDHAGRGDGLQLARDVMPAPLVYTGRRSSFVDSQSAGTMLVSPPGSSCGRDRSPGAWGMIAARRGMDASEPDMPSVGNLDADAMDGLRRTSSAWMSRMSNHHHQMADRHTHQPSLALTQVQCEASGRSQSRLGFQSVAHPLFLTR